MHLRVSRRGLHEYIVIHRSDLLPTTEESATLEWLRAVAEDDSQRAALLQLADPSADGEDEAAVDAVLQRLAGLLASGHLRLVRLGSPAPRLDPPTVVPLSSLSDDPITPVAPAMPQTEAETWFEVRVVGPFDEPLAGIDVVLDNDGQTHRVRTESDGRARLDPGRGRSATASISAAPALRDALRRRWSQPASRPMLGKDDGVHVLHYRDDLLGPVMLSPEQPQTLSIQPFVVLGRMVGIFFERNRDFLLPVGRDAVAEMRALYDRCAPCRLLVVGHTDTVGTTEDNDALSLARARSVAAFLTNDIDAWLDRYCSGAPGLSAWGDGEDRHMLGGLADAAQRPPGLDAVEWFQQTRGLVVDGIVGPNTRRALVTETMQVPGTTLPSGVSIEVHGCGEAFPLAASGHELDQAPSDGNDDPIDRRVELFFFGDSMGVQPELPGPTSGADTDVYSTWRQRAHQTYERVLGAHALEIELVDEADQPIPDARYTVRLPMGVLIDGTLDERGTARIERLPPGTLRVDFPDLGRGFQVATSSPLREDG